MTATYLGSVSLGAAVPGVGLAVQAGTEGVNAALPDIEGKLSALAAQLAALLAMPPVIDFGVSLALVEATLGAVKLAINTPGLLPPPSLSTAILAIQTQIGLLTAALGLVRGKLALLVNLGELLTAAGVHVVAFDGSLGSFGSQVAGVIDPVGSSGTRARAVVLMTTSSTTWTALSQLLKVG